MGSTGVFSVYLDLFQTQHFHPFLACGPVTLLSTLPRDSILQVALDQNLSASCVLDPSRRFAALAHQGWLALICTVSALFPEMTLEVIWSTNLRTRRHHVAVVDCLESVDLIYSYHVHLKELYQAYLGLSTISYITYLFYPLNASLHHLHVLQSALHLSSGSQRLIFAQDWQSRMAVPHRMPLLPEFEDPY